MVPFIPPWKCKLKTGIIVSRRPCDDRMRFDNVWLVLKFDMNL